MKAREISQLSRSKTPRDTKLLMGFDVPSGHHQTWQASANLKFTKDYTMDVEPQLRPGAPKAKATWSAPKYGYHKTSGLHVAAMNTTNLLARGASRTRKVTSVPQTVWQSCSRHRRIHFLSIHLFFFFHRKWPYSFRKQLERSPQVLNTRGHNKHYKPTSCGINEGTITSALPPKHKDTGARRKQYLNNSRVQETFVYSRIGYVV